MQTDQPPADTIVLTAALPYANGPLHIGHAVEYVLADILARHYRSSERRCYFVCADDAHGAPIQMRAEDQGVTPDELINTMHAAHTSDFKRLGVSFDIYSSTHSETNQRLVSQAYAGWQAYGCLYTAELRQLYDPTEGRFLADRYVRGDCPKCGAPDQYGDSCERCGATYDALELRNAVAARTKAKLEVRSANHVFFDMSKFEDALRTWGADIGLQEGIARKLDEWFSQGLRPWCLSRTAPYFGFAIPDRVDQYFYVWVDAPMGYLSSFSEYCDTKGLKFEEIISSPNTHLFHIIGKDIAAFHCLYWPAMLMAAGRKLPNRIHCHGFLTVNGEKMSKSRGTFVELSRLLDTIDPDTFRFFVFAMLSDGQEDIDLNISAFVERVNADLLGKVVNIASRASSLLHSLTGGEMSSQLADDVRFSDYLTRVKEAIGLVEPIQFSAACRRLMSLAETTNKWISDAAPWALAKGNADERALASQICSQALLEFRALMIALSPVTPALAERALGLFLGDLDGEKHSYAHLDPRANLARMSIKPFEHLMSRLELESVRSLVSPPGQPD